jgi:hypothetical protein
MSRFGERRPQPTGPGVGRCGGTDQGARASVAARPPASEAADSVAAPASGVIGLAPSEARRRHPRYSNRPQRFSPRATNPLVVEAVRHRRASFERVVLGPSSAQLLQRRRRQYRTASTQRGALPPSSNGDGEGEGKHSIREEIFIFRLFTKMPLHF